MNDPKVLKHVRWLKNQFRYDFYLCLGLMINNIKEEMKVKNCTVDEAVLVLMPPVIDDDEKKFKSMFLRLAVLCINTDSAPF